MVTGNVWAVTMVKDEADIIDATLAHLLAHGVDGIIVSDNMSSDGTFEVVERLAGTWPQITVQVDGELGYYQAAKMSRLAEQAYEHGAEWIIPFDADELWWTHRSESLADMLRASSDDVVWAGLTNYFPTDDDPDEKSPFRRIVHRQPQPQDLPKVAVRWRPGSIIWQGNHGVSLAGEGRRDDITRTDLAIAHFPYRSEEQFLRKAVNGAAAYKATDLPEDQGVHWRAYGDMVERGGEQALLDHYHRWFHFAHPEGADPQLVRDPAPLRGWGE